MACQEMSCQTNYVKNSGRFPLTAVGKIDLYPLFAEHCLNCSKEAWGLVMPTGIALNQSTQKFFAKLIKENRLISLYDFENKEALFDIHRMFKFCLLTAGKTQKQSRNVQSGFYLTRLDHLLDPSRIYILNTDDLKIFNPNSMTCSVFRSSKDADLTKKIYSRLPILYNETTGYDPWEIRYGTLFNMASNSDLFFTCSELLNKGAKWKGNGLTLNDDEYWPLYEGKMYWHYNHHYGTWPVEGNRPNAIPNTEINNLQDMYAPLSSWYYVKSSEVKKRLVKLDGDGKVQWEWKHSYYIGFRDITNATNERTCVASIIPSNSGTGDNTPLIFSSKGILYNMCLLAMISSIPFDYVARQKVGGSHLNYFIMDQKLF